MREELVKLIESTSSAYKEFSQQKADTSSQLERLASELADQSKEVLEPLPELGEGPDEVASVSIHCNLRVLTVHTKCLEKPHSEVSYKCVGKWKATSQYRRRA